MPPRSSPSRGIGRFLKGFAHRAKKAFKPQGQAVGPRTPSPLPPPSLEAPLPQLVPARERVPEPFAESQQSVTLPQAAPSASQSTPTTPLLTANAIEQTNAESSVSQTTKQVGADAWNGLRGTLRLLEKSSDAFPPFKSAVAGFLDIVDFFETAAQNREDYGELALDLDRMARQFREHRRKHTSSKMLEALNAMANGLQEEMKHVQGRQQRSGFRRYVEGVRDSIDVEECYKRVETLRRELQDKAMLRIWSLGEEQQADTRLEKLNAALEAIYDSTLSDVIGRRTCTAGTRESILAGMWQWADDPDGARVYWLDGMAGTGKTTLAYSFCAMLDAKDRLGASFFCSRAYESSRSASRIVPTIAYQLALLLPAYQEELIRQIGEDKIIGVRRIDTQFERLIRDPLLAIKDQVREGIVITIDALDECDEREGAKNILDVLFRYAQDLPIKFFVTCRPEPGLFDVLDSESERHRSVLHLHNIEASFVRADIKTYLEAELAVISLSQHEIGQLAEQAGTLFIYAATAVRYILPKGRQVNVRRRLKDLLSMTSTANADKHKQIDNLYAAVLAAPFSDEDLSDTEKENIRLVLDTAVCAREPMSVSTMMKLLGLEDEQDITLALQHLRSVLHVSHGEGLVSTFHASFPDFMLSRKRSGDHCCNAAEHNRQLALCCFSTMERLLRFNICDLESSFVFDKDIPDRQKKINSGISPELFYACRYWEDHLRLVEAPDDARSALGEFLSKRLLFWMEVMNLRNCIGAGAEMLDRAHSWLQKWQGANDMLELALDADKFVTAFGMNPVSRSTPHIYVSALPFWPETRRVRQRYWERVQGLIRLEGPAMERRDLSCLATWSTPDEINCVAFSHDGSRIASGSDDNTIRVWDARSGDVVAGPFEGHTKRVWSVAFSPNGNYIVSGSQDNTIRVWDARSGDAVAGLFEGHTGTVYSVAFSPDGTRIVSGSSDETIRIWGARSGDVVAGPFGGHIGVVYSVAFSPDGTRIVSGSGDNTIRVWDAYSGGAVTGPFEGHTDGVYSVAFSPDGTHIVSGSSDSTIRVWDARSGDVAAGPFEGHTGAVRSVVFSSDGTRIVSGSEDRTIRFWDVCSGDVVGGPFEGHTGTVYSVAFSPDGTRIVSGSGDKTLRVWDARSGLVKAGSSEGHTNTVHSVAFSPDSTYAVSGSEDNTIRVWDAHSGDVVAGPFKGHTGAVYSVAFSPDGIRIASGSYDDTIRVWDARSGDAVAGPFGGHTGTVYSVAFSPDGTRIVSGSHDNTIRVWDARSGDAVAGPFEGHTSVVYSVAFSPDGTRIVSGSHDKTIRVWDARSGDVVAGPFKGHTSTVYSVAFSPDSTRIASGSHDNTIRVWNARSGDAVAGPFKGHTNWVNSVAFSPDGSHIVSGSFDNAIRVWDAHSGDMVAGPFEGHAGAVHSVAFSPDGTRIVSGSSDRAIRFWDVSVPDLRRSRLFGGWTMSGEGLIISQQGQLLLCVPVELRTGLTRPQNTLCIYDKGSLSLDFNGVLLGCDWFKCYRC